MRILITNVALLGRYGTEMYVRDLVHELKRRGHTPIVYSTRLGEIADELRAEEVLVTDNLNSIETPPDVIHGHHHPETMTALLSFPGVPGIFVCHDRLVWYDAPPIFPRILRYVAVDYNCRERFTEGHLIPDNRIQVILNSVDLLRFKPRAPLPLKPRRALLFSNYASENGYLTAVREACSQQRLLLDVVGMGVGNVCKNPENILGQYDLIFAKAKCALEALASGAAVILCDYRGMGGMVTTDRLDEMRRFNFGMRLLTQPVTPEILSKEIERYHAADAADVSKKIRETAGLSAMTDQLLDLYQNVISEYQGLGKRHDGAEEKAALAYLRTLIPVLQESRELRSRNEVLETEISSLKGHFKNTLADLQTDFENTVLALRADIGAVYNTRTMRLRNFLMRSPIVKAITELIK